MKAKFIFEAHDSVELQRDYPMSNNALKNFVKLKDHNRFEYGRYDGKGSLELNNKIANALFPEDFDAYAAAEIAYKIIINYIPELKSFKLNTDHFQSKTHYLNLRKELPIKEKKLNDEYSVKIDLWITYFVKDDEIMDEKTNSFKLLFSPKITTSRTSVNPFNVSSDEFEEIGDINNNEEVENLMGKLSNLLDGTPDNEDKKYNENLKISSSNLSIEDIKQILPEIKKNLNLFNSYIKYKYEISLF